MTLFRLLTEGSRVLELAGSPDPKQDAQQLLLAAFHLDMVHFLMTRMTELEESSKNQASIRLYRDMIGRRKKRCPLQHILGWQEFMGMEFMVNRHVLIPRQDTETLVEKVLEHQEKEKKKGQALLDLCTGSGCIAVSLAAKGGFDRVTGTDISEEALKVARRNGEILLSEWKKTGMIEFFQGDLFDALPKNGEKYDVITSNPPYIPTGVIQTLEPEVRDFEPPAALDGDEDGLYFYKKIGERAADYLKPKGSLYLEIGYDQKRAVCRILEDQGYKEIQVYKDLPGHDRVIMARQRD